jgi:hypothetical protein
MNKETLREGVLLELVPAGSICAEIGVWKGDFSEQILKTVCPELLVLIDPWKSEEYEGAWYNCSQDEMDLIHSEVISRFSLEIAKGSIGIVSMYSTNAALLFEEEFFDFIYIDGCHLYGFVRDDLRHYFPKLKPGGVIIGDDYGIEGWWDNGVTKAFDEFSHPDMEYKYTIQDQFIIRKR